MKNCLISKEIVQKKLDECGVDNLDDASIREVVKIANQLQKENNIPFIRMEMGVPVWHLPKSVQRPR